MSGKSILLAGALLAATGVTLGAFGAHTLGDTLGERQMGWWETAVQYQMWHAVALVAIAALPMRRTGLAAACLALGAGIFSGALYRSDERAVGKEGVSKGKSRWAAYP